MGRLNPIPAAATPDPSKPVGHADQPSQHPDEQPITHFLHAHPLRRTVLPAGYPCPVCSGCQKPCPAMSPVYTCTLCPSLTLDASCFAAPQITIHRAHAGHQLRLLGTPPYPDGSFRCDACGEEGRAFCYHCTKCADFDIHASCAQAPAKVVVPEHEDELELVFPGGADTASGSLASLGFRCDVCGGVGAAGTWRYRCEACDFDAHLKCALDEAQSQQELPAAQAQRLGQRTTVGVLQQPPQPRPTWQNQHQAPWSTGQTQYQQQQPVQPPWSSGQQSQQQAPTPPWASQQQPPVANLYAEILNQQKKEMESLTYFFKTLNENQDRMTAEVLLGAYQRPSALLAGVGGQGVLGAASLASPLYPYGSGSVGGASASSDALLQGLSNMSLNGAGGSGGLGLGGSATYPSGLGGSATYPSGLGCSGGGGGEQQSALLSQIMGQQNQGGTSTVPPNLADVIGGVAGLDSTSLMSFLFL